MGLINLSDRERKAIGAIDGEKLRENIDQAITTERLGQFSNLPLNDAGEPVTAKLRYFGQALTAYRIAKSARKRNETSRAVQKAGGDLLLAVSQMKERLETVTCSPFCPRL